VVRVSGRKRVNEASEREKRMAAEGNVVARRNSLVTFGGD